MNFRKRLYRITGPAASLLIHLLLIVLLGAAITIDVKRPDPDQRTITVYMEPHDATRVIEQIPELQEIDRKMDGLVSQADAVDFSPDLSEPDMFESIDVSAPDYPAWDLPVTVSSPLKIMMNSTPSESLIKRKGSAFGFGKRVDGDLVGTMYDLKRHSEVRSRQVDYVSDVRYLVESVQAGHDPAKFYKVPRQIYLSHLFVPNLPAEEGPKTFGVEGLMKPTNFLIHYRGLLQSPVPGRYRFVGDFDDVLIVLVDGKVVLESVWCDPVTGWEARELVGEHMSFTKHHLTYGDWVELSPVRSKRIDIFVGENPGGAICGVLMVEEEGKTYKQAKDGRPILPIYTVQPLTEKEQRSLRRNKADWAFASDTPLMGKRATQFTERVEEEDDIKVLIQ